MFRNLDLFVCEDHSEIMLEMVVKANSKISEPVGFLLINKDVKWVAISEGIYSHSLYFCDEETKTILCRADVNYEWGLAEITYLKNCPQAEGMVAGFLLEIIFRNRIIFNQGVVIHASAVSYKGLGIIFTAPTQTGKSTQAKLWAKHLGAQVLNDDRPVLRLENRRTRVYGTPWSGEKRLFLNKAVELNAIILLEQAKENRLKGLTLSTSCAQILPRCFLPYYDLEIMDKCLKTLGEMLLGVPVYLLECKPDREAVDLVFRAILNRQKYL
ncbi:hypothetical protein [Desulfosporosinus sp. HMP52]|uniref:hypothetical protein n=1 Tax=Desulfosporosinus sp. HMP52 TaxID=1487923 RepID=UPI001FA75EA0|nr:hypothetical protein [Desulfosporosinus sp. HMP52]